MGIAEPLYEWNDLEGAVRYVTEGTRLSELGGRQSYVLAGRVVLARVQHARGYVDKASALVQGMERLAQQLPTRKQEARFIVPLRFHEDAEQPNQDEEPGERAGSAQDRRADESRPGERPVHIDGEEGPGEDFEIPAA